MICRNCQKEFDPPKQRGRKSRFCCEECKKEWKRAQPQKPMKFTKICEHCGKEYKTNNSRQKYCCRKCSEAVRKTGRTVYTKNCLYCGKEFQTISKDQKYCSAACASRHAGEQRKGEYFCEYCGKPRYSDHPNRNRFCSRECSDKARWDETRRMREKHKMIRAISMTRTCDFCGSTFVAREKANRFCSSECRNQNILMESHLRKEEQFSPQERICSYCGNTFKTTLRAQGKLYCSELCKKRAERHRHKKKRRQLMKKAFVERVGLKITYKAYKGYCAICGLPVPPTSEPSNTWAATVDHIQPLSKGGLHHRDNCQLAHRMCNSVKNDVEGGFLIDWEAMLSEKPGRWDSQFDDLWDQLDKEEGKSGMAV